MISSTFSLFHRVGCQPNVDVSVGFEYGVQLEISFFTVWAQTADVCTRNAKLANCFFSCTKRVHFPFFK